MKNVSWLGLGIGGRLAAVPGTPLSVGELIEDYSRDVIALYITGVSFSLFPFGPSLVCFAPFGIRPHRCVKSQEKIR